MDLLKFGSDWLVDQLKAHVARQVVYQRGASEITVTATIGRTLLKLDDGYGGVRVEWTDRDFLIPAAELILAGVPVLPERGDQIREVDGAVVHLFEVMTPSGEPPWRWSDVYRKLFRIHTKRIGSS